MIETTDKEMIKILIEEFGRLQYYMKLTPKEADSYGIMKMRYNELKAILQSSGVNLTDIDYIQEIE